MTTAPCDTSKALTVLFPEPIPPVRPTRSIGVDLAGRGVAIGRDVDVVHVIGSSTAPVGHCSPTVTGPLHGPDVLVPDDLTDAECPGVLLRECGDLVAECRI